MDILDENSTHTYVRVSFCFHLQAYTYIEFIKTIDILKILELNTKPRAGPFNWADQILCDTGVHNKVKVLVKVLFSNNNSDVFEWNRLILEH